MLSLFPLVIPFVAASKLISSGEDSRRKVSSCGSHPADVFLCLTLRWVLRVELRTEEFEHFHKYWAVVRVGYVQAFFGGTPA